MPSSGGTSSLMLNFPWASCTSGVTSQPFRLIHIVGGWLLRASSRDLNRYRCRSLYVNQYRLYDFSVNFFGLAGEEIRG